MKREAGSSSEDSRALRRVPFWLLAVPLLTASAGVSADTFSVGIGAGADRGRVDCVASFDCNRSSTHLKLTAAYRFDDHIDLQLAYFDAGHFKGGDLTPMFATPFGGTFKVGGFGLTAGYRYSFAPLWSATVRAGVASMRTRFEYANPAYGSVSQSNAEPLLGLGVAYSVSPDVRIGLDYDVTRFKVYTSRGPLQMLGVGLQYSF